VEERVLGQNIDAKIDGKILTLTIDLSRDVGPSKSGKSRIVATTSGNIQLPDGAKIGLNIYRGAAR